jgi:hypothetical protein
LHWRILLCGKTPIKIRKKKMKGTFVNPGTLLSDCPKSGLWSRRKTNWSWRYKKGYISLTEMKQELTFLV